jgi:uncharacterized OsmC-like protein
MAGVAVTVRHRKGLQAEASARTHRLLIDRPVDLGGEDAGMTLGELFLSSLGTCTLLTVLTFCKNSGIPIDGGEVHLTAEMADHPKRVGAIHQRLVLTGPVDAALRERLLRVAKGCAIHNTLEHAPALHLTIQGAD